MVQYPELIYVSIFSTIFPLFAGIYAWRSIGRELRILVLYLAFVLIADVLMMWVIKNYSINLGLMHFYFLIEYIFVVTIIISWQESSRMKRLFQALLLFYVIFWLIAKLTFEPLNGLYSITASVSSVLLALFAGYTLFIVIGNRVQPLFISHSFWVLLSFIIYFAGTLLLIALQGILVRYSREDIFLAASINWSLKILISLLFTAGILCPRTQP